MTCIIGLIEGGNVYLGGDAMIVGRGFGTVTPAPKVFRKIGRSGTGEILVGCAGRSRFCDVVEHGWNVPAIPSGGAVELFVRGKLLASLREALRDDPGSPGTMIIGIRGRLFSMESDFSIIESTDPFAACGSGDTVALGALCALNGVGPEARIRRALEAAAHLQPSVSPPFTIIVGAALGPQREENLAEAQAQAEAIVLARRVTSVLSRRAEAGPVATRRALTRIVDEAAA